MPSYTVTAVTIGTFALGESDKILTLFTAERGPVRAVAKGARKPGAKISGRSDVLDVNKLLVNTGRSLDIITQSEGVETFRPLRQDLERLSYCLYYAELTQFFGQGLAEESELYFEFLINSIRQQSEKSADACLLCLEFELSMLDLLGLKPELDACVTCRTPLTDHLLADFHYELGGIVCQRCSGQTLAVRETGRGYSGSNFGRGSQSIHITPLVWKRLVLASQGQVHESSSNTTTNLERANQAARRVTQSYIEHRAGRRMKSLDLISQL